MNKLQKILSSVAILGTLSASANARDIICNREVEVCVPKVVTMQQTRNVTQEVPVVCYQTEKRLVNRTFIEPTCDPCNPFVQRTCQQEINVSVPYVSKQLVQRQIVENVSVVQYQRERRTVPVTVHVDDCPRPNYTPQCETRGNNWYPGKIILETTGEILGDIKEGFQKAGQGIQRLGYRNNPYYAPINRPSTCFPNTYSPRTCAPNACAPVYNNAPVQRNPEWTIPQEAPAAPDYRMNNPPPAPTPQDNRRDIPPPEPTPANSDSKPQGQETGFSTDRVANNIWRASQ